MANQTAWEDRDKILDILRNIELSLVSFKNRFETLIAMKIEIFDNPERASELKKIIDEDPTWTMQGLADKYQTYKAIYDLLKNGGYI